jgi:outer membrane protein
MTAILCVVVLTAAQAQQPAQKIGYVDADYVLQQLPALKKAEKELQDHQTQLKTQMDAKMAEYQNKEKAYLAMPATTPDVTKRANERDLQTLAQNLQTFQQEAQASIQRKTEQLLSPLYKQVNDAVQTVAKENGFSFIIRENLGPEADILLFVDEKFSINDLVLKKLGVVSPTPKP